MMRIRVVSVGKMKERWWLEAQAEYIKRLSRFARVEIVEVKDSPTPDNPTPAEREAVLRQEAARALPALAGFDAVAVLAIEGKPRTSEQFAAALAPYIHAGKSICFVIGGSLGLSGQIKAEADELLSLSPLTFPHRLARVALLEQLFRAFKILNGEVYHK